MHALHEQVADLIRTVADRIVMPYFRNLSSGDVVEKEPGDLVTVADRLAEQALTEGLAKIAPGSTIIGEEGVAATPSLMDGISGEMVWIVDPIDGTGNYAAGHPQFAIMVALAKRGVVEAGWIFDPLSNRMIHAVRGQGAFRDGVRLSSRTIDATLPVAALGTRFLPPDLCGAFERRSIGRAQLVPTPMCAGEQYPRLALGVNDIAIFWRSFPWDHAAGSLLLAETGGRLAGFDGTPYRIDGRGLGLIGAATEALWTEAAQIFLARDEINTG